MAVAFQKPCRGDCLILFTTKPVGKGTGLGLSISYEIVTQKHGGHLKCISAPGKGTEFMIEIPYTKLKRKKVTC